MSIFEDVLLNAKNAVDTVGKKAGKVIDVSKLTLAAADIKSEISQKYEILGRISYEEQVNGKSYEKSKDELVKKITELMEQLDTVNEMIANAKHKTKCPSCGSYNVEGAIFCNKCGEKIASEKNTNEEETFSPEDALDFAEDNFADDDNWSI